MILALNCIKSGIMHNGLKKSIILFIAIHFDAIYCTTKKKYCDRPSIFEGLKIGKTSTRLEA